MSRSTSRPLVMRSKFSRVRNSSTEGSTATQVAEQALAEARARGEQLQPGFCGSVRGAHVIGLLTGTTAGAGAA